MMRVDSAQVLDNHEHFYFFPPPATISITLDSYSQSRNTNDAAFLPSAFQLFFSILQSLQSTKKKRKDMRRISSSSLFNYKVLAMDQQAERSPLDLIGMHIDPEAGKEKTRTKSRYFPSAPSIFRILSLWIIFLSITAVVAGCISGDWGASSCKFTLTSFPITSSL
jgi:hypothetical protein